MLEPNLDTPGTETVMPGGVTAPSNNASTSAVLVVDDEAYVRKVIGRWLTEAGLSWAQAENADAAWEYLQRHEVQVVTLDVSMPGRSGADLLPQIREHYPDTEVIMLTAHDETKLAIRMLTHGAFGFLVKPVSWEDFVPQVRKAMERRQSAIRQRQYLKDLEEESTFYRKGLEPWPKRSIGAGGR